MPLTGATIAFDLDGTLVDTAPDIVGVLNVILAERGLPAVSLASTRHLVGRGARGLLEHGFREAGATFHPGDGPELVERFMALYLDRIALESRPYEGVEAALDELAAAGARLCVCTNKPTDLSRALLKAVNLLDWFQAVVGCDAVAARKPDPAHLVEAVKRAGGDPDRAAMVGDSAVDVASARAAAIPVALVSFGYAETPVEELAADVILDRYADLFAWVQLRLNGPARAPLTSQQTGRG